MLPAPPMKTGRSLNGSSLPAEHGRISALLLIQLEVSKRLEEMRELKWNLIEAKTIDQDSTAASVFAQ